jgi:hypothetical protein
MLAILGLGIIFITTTAGPASATAKSYHIKNTAPDGYWGVDKLVLYTGLGCTGTKHVLDNGESAKSDGWVSFATFSGYLRHRNRESPEVGRSA